MNNVYSLVVGTTALLLMMTAIISFIFLFQRKLLKKQHAYREIEQLLQKQELTATYSIIEARETERKRIAEDLHDNIGSILATLRIYSDLMVENSEPSEYKRFSVKISELTDQAATETRRISHDLDSGVMKHFGLGPSIQQLTKAISDTHALVVDLVLDISPDLNGELSLNTYRIIQELFNNVLKHAAASKVRLEISQIDQEYLSIIFEDNGKGFLADQPSNGIGLKNIKARAERYRGSLVISSTPQVGTTSIIEIPLA